MSDKSCFFFFLNVDLSCFFFNSAAEAQGVVFVKQAGHKPSHKNGLDQAFCFRSVRSAAQETIEGKGWTTGKQQHRGVRKEKSDWLKSKGWTRIPYESTVRRYAVDEAEEEPEDGFEDDVEGGMVGTHLTGQQVAGFLNPDDDA